MNKPIVFFDPKKGFYWAKPTKITAPTIVDVEPLALYTKRTWVGLMDDEVYKIAFALEGEHWRKIADAIEAKLKEKNT